MTDAIMAHVSMGHPFYPHDFHMDQWVGNIILTFDASPPTNQQSARFYANQTIRLAHYAEQPITAACVRVSPLYVI